MLVVQDHGHGVPPSALSNLFEPFYRVSLDRPAHPESAGLGLAITQRAVQLHGASVSASNNRKADYCSRSRCPWGDLMVNPLLQYQRDLSGRYRPNSRERKGADGIRPRANRRVFW
jgi:signal transduction histidine kinase